MQTPEVAGSNPVPATDNPVSKETGFCFVFYVQRADTHSDFALTAWLLTATCMPV